MYGKHWSSGLGEAGFEYMNTHNLIKYIYPNAESVYCHSMILFSNCNPHIFDMYIFFVVGNKGFIDTSFFPFSAIIY